MAYSIPQDTIERVRSQADIVQVVSEYLTLKKAGGNFKALCPFHQEKTPSFMVSPSKQIYHCFGCGAGGNVFGFLMQQEGFTFPEAVRFLAERMGIQIKEHRRAPGEGELRERLFELYDFATRFYSRCLLKSPESEHAREYLRRRQISEEAIREFSIGHAPSGWDAFLSAAARKKEFSKKLLLEAGLAKKSAEGRIYDTFRNRIMFPIWGLSGKVIAFGGRALEEDQPKYINSPETPIYQKGQILYNLNRAKKSVSNKDSVVVVEGYTDAIRLVLGGIDNVVASSGTAFTQAQARLLKRYAGEVVLVFDRDAAGKIASARGIEVLFAENLAVKATDDLPPGMDPDEFVAKYGAEAFLEVLKSAKNFLDYLVEKKLLEWKNEIGSEDKIKTANALASLIGKISDPIRKEEYFRQVASRLDVSIDALLKASQKGGSADRIEEEVRHFEIKLRREEKEYMWLIKLMLEHPESIGRVREHLESASIGNEALRELFGAVFEFEDKPLEQSALLDRIQNQEAQQILSKLMFGEFGPELLYPVEWWIGSIKSRQREKTLSELSREIAEAEREGGAELVERLLRRKAEVSRDLAEIKKDMMKVSVDSSAESVIGG